MSIFSRIKYLGLGSSLLLSTACGPKSIDEADYVKEYSTAVCDFMAGCCSEASVNLDEAQCKANAALDVDEDSDSLAIEYDGEAAADCLKAIKNASCDLDDSDEESLESCGRVYRPTLKEGEPCRSSAECVDPPGGYAICTTDFDPSVSSSGSVCQVYDESDFDEFEENTLPWGESCTENYECQSHLACLDNVCEKRREAGGECTSSSHCEEELRCIEGTCGKGAPEGESCDVDVQCESEDCVNGSCAHPIAEICEYYSESPDSEEFEDL